MSNGHGPGEALQMRFGEDLRHLAHAALRVKPRPVRGDDAGRLLASVLKGVEAEVGQVGRLRVSEDPENAALVVEPIVIEPEGIHGADYTT